MKTRYLAAAGSVVLWVVGLALLQQRHRSSVHSQNFSPHLQLSQVDPSLLAKGPEIFDLHCAYCHGEHGQGDGVGGLNMSPPPTNLILGPWKFGESERQLFEVLTHGVSGTAMGGFPQLSEEERWALVHFIQTSRNDQLKQ